MKITVFLENDTGDFKIQSSSEAMNRDWLFMKLPELLEKYEKQNPGYKISGFKIMYKKEKNGNRVKHH